MKPLEESSTPFFARILSAELACPRCDYVTRIGRGARLAADAVKHQIWNPLTCRWRCPRCTLTLRLGVVAHPVLPSSTLPGPPMDTIPNLKQALELRNQQSYITPDRISSAAGVEVNRVGGEQEPAPEDDLTTAAVGMKPVERVARARKAQYWAPARPQRKQR